ncbi:MAG: M48 family metallopeptidase [Caldisphaeraceae archaeon]|nr:M48 family metallopeptidase [Caldisphaeraceae archaeon]
MKKNMNKRSEKALKDNSRRKIEEIADGLLEKNGVELFGNLRIEIVNIDTLVLIKGNKIYVNVDARKYPNYTLKYTIAHELAHLIIKGHTKRFWEIVKQIYPEYEKAKNELLRRQGHKKL